MSDRKTNSPPKRRPPKPLDSSRLQQLALAYVARFSTSSAKLEAYLRRKLRERGWTGGDEPGVTGLVERYVALGYIDDAAYAKSRAGGLLRRGYGPRRVAQTLRAAGIGEDIRNSVDPGEYEARQAAGALARKRRFGPFAAEMPDRDRREKQIAAMLRAGHGFDAARAVLSATSEAQVEQWVAEAQEEDE